MTPDARNFGDGLVPVENLENIPDQPSDDVEMDGQELLVIVLAGVQELFQRVFFLEGVLAEALGIISENAEQPHSLAEKLRELLTENEEG